MIKENKEMKVFLDKILKKDTNLNGFKFNRFGLNFNFECFAILKEKAVIIKVTESENTITLSMHGEGINVKKILLDDYEDILKKEGLIKESPELFKSMESAFDELNKDIFSSTDLIIMSLTLHNSESLFNLKLNCFISELKEHKKIRFTNEEYIELYELIADTYLRLSDSETKYLLKILSEYNRNDNFEDLKNLLILNYNI